MKKNILCFILGMIVAGGVAGVVAYSYNAKDVGYTPNDNTWNVSSTKQALDDLYVKSKNVPNLSTQTTATAADILRGKTAYNSLGNLITGTATVECITGSFKITSAINTSSGIDIETDFTPSRFFISYFGYAQDATDIYIGDYNPSKFYEYYYDKSSGNAYDLSSYYNINGKLNVHNFIAPGNNATAYYMACK